MTHFGSGKIASRRQFLVVSAGMMALTALQACSSGAPAPTQAPAAPAAQPAAPTATTAAAAAAPTATPAPAAKPAAGAAPAGNYTTTGTKGQVHVFYGADSSGFFKKVIDQFTQETGIGVQWEIAPADYQQLEQLLTTRFVAGDASTDAIHQDDLYTIIHGSAGWLEPLDPLVKQYNLDLSDWPTTLIKDVSTWDGKLYRLPWGNDTEIWFYRTDLFKEAGVEPPKDWNGFVDVAKKLTKGTDLYGIALAGKIGGAFGNDIQHWTHQAGGAIDRLDDPGSQEAMSFYKDLFKKYKVAPPSVPQDDYGSILQDFLNNKYAMWWCWDGFLGAMRQTKDFWHDQVSAFLPFQGPKNHDTVTACWGWVMSKFSQKKDLAGEWLNFTAKPDVMKMQMARGRVPSRVSLWTDKDVQDNAPSAPFVKQAYDAGALAARPITPSIQQIYDAAEHAMSAYLTDQVDLAGAVKDAMTKIKDIQAKAAKAS